MKKKHIYLVRHGETEQLAQNLRQTETSRLSERGHAQARACAERFGAHGFAIEALMTSPFTRTQETAAYIAERTSCIPSILSEACERRLPSSFAGHAFDDPHDRSIMRTIFNLWMSDPHARFADEETYAELCERVKSAQRILASCEAERIAVVTHGVFAKVFLAQVLHVHEYHPETFVALYDTSQMAYTGISEYTYTEADGWKLVTWNDHSHILSLASGHDTSR